MRRLRAATVKKRLWEASGGKVKNVSDDQLSEVVQMVSEMRVLMLNACVYVPVGPAMGGAAGWTEPGSPSGHSKADMVFLNAVPGEVLDRQCKFARKIQSWFRKMSARNLLNTSSKAATRSAAQSVEEVLVRPRECPLDAMQPGTHAADIKQARDRINDVSRRMEAASVNLEGHMSKIDELDSMLEACCGNQAVGYASNFQSPWLFLDRVELGHMSASCSSNHRHVGEQTPFAAYSAEGHSTVTDAEREEDYDMSCDELDCDELEDIYQRALADDPSDVERRFAELFEVRRGVVSERRACMKQL